METIEKPITSSVFFNNSKDQKRLNIFMDTEFTELSKRGELISIGFITENNETFYAEINDYDVKTISEKNKDWMDKKVINNLLIKDKDYMVYEEDKMKVIKCKLRELKLHLTEWFESLLSQKQYKEIEVWSDCLAFDWVHFVNIFGTSKEVPKYIYYIPFDICTYFKLYNIDPDISREEYALVNGIKEIEEYKHNSLYDAIIIRRCYNRLMGFDLENNEFDIIKRIKEIE